MLLHLQISSAKVKLGLKCLMIMMVSFVLILSTHPSKSLSSTKPEFVDIRSINSRIALDIRYATSNNFTGQKLYAQARCLLRPSTAEKLSQVQIELESQGLGLSVYDCYRPLSVQKMLWKIVSDERYVANPAKGSRHNRGAAVDLTLITQTGKVVEMPTQFDDFTERAHRDYDKISPTARKNRRILEVVMRKHGFVPLRTEWWHFDEQGWNQYPIADIPFESIPR